MSAGGGKKLFVAVRTILLPVLLTLCYLGGVAEYLRIPDNPSAAVLLSNRCPDRGQVQEILETEAKSDFPADSCFLYQGGIQKVFNENLGRQTEAMAVGLLGKNVLYDWQCQGLAQDDRKGCIIDRKTAWELFGSTDAAGGVIKLGSRTLTVRKVANWEQSVVVFVPSDRDAVYTQVFVRPQKGETKEKAADEFLMRHGLFGTMMQSGPWKSAAFLSLLLLPAALWITFWKRARAKQRACQRFGKEYWVWTAALLLLVGTVGFLVWKYVRIPGDWIPSRWSDFAFWGKKISQWRSRFWWYLMMQKTVWQAQAVLGALQTGGLAVFSLILYVLCKKRGG